MKLVFFNELHHGVPRSPRRRHGSDFSVAGLPVGSESKGRRKARRLLSKGVGQGGWECGSGGGVGVALGVGWGYIYVEAGEG